MTRRAAIGEYTLAVTKNNALGVCAFLGHVSGRGLLKEQTAALVLPCMDLIRALHKPQVAVPSLVLLAFRPPDFPMRDDQWKEFLACAHVPALWIHKRGAEWYEENLQKPDSRGDGRNVPDVSLPLAHRPYTSRAELLQSWINQFDALAVQAHPLSPWAKAAKDAAAKLRALGTGNGMNSNGAPDH